MINKIINKIKRNDEKDTTIIRNIFFSSIIRGLTLLLALIKMPMYISFFDNEEILGIWFTLLSILSWIFNFDLGIGNGLRNRLVKPIEEKNNKETQRYISSAYFSIFFLILTIGTILSIIIPFINWNVFFNTTTNTVDNIIFIETIYIVLIGLLIQFFLKLINSVLYALQKSFLPGLFSFISELMLLVIINLLDKTMDISNKLICIALSYSLCVCIPLFIANIVIFSTKLKFSKPTIKMFSKKYAKSVLFIGGMFFGVQIMYMILMNTNEYLITRFVGPKNVIEYQVYNKIFSLIGTLFGLILAPMWSMVTKAIVNKDYVWIKKLYNKLKMLTICAVCCEFLLIPFVQILVNLWLGDNTYKVNNVYSILFATLGSLIIWNGVISTIVNGMGKLKVQFVTMVIGVVLNIPLAYVFCNMTNSWIGVVLANIISFIPYCISQPIYINKYIKEGIMLD